MSDDLVKRLRNATVYDATCFTDEAADRIEELEATLLATCKREAATQARHDAKVTALEARADALAEALGDAVAAWNTHQQLGEPMEGWWVHDARATLAQITGETDD